MIDGPKYKRLLRGIVLVGLGLRLLGLTAVLVAPERAHAPDSLIYLQLAADLEGGFIGPADDARYIEGLLRTPGYPLFVSLLDKLPFPIEASIAVGQIVLALLTVLLVADLGYRLFGPRAGLAAALFVALDPVSLMHNYFILTETLFTSALVSAIWLWVRAVRDGSIPLALSAGAVSGVAILIRPISTYLPFLLAGAFLISFRLTPKKRMALVLTFSMGCGATAGAWVLRNLRATGVPLVSTVESINLLYFRAADSLARSSDVTIEEARTRLYDILDDRLASLGVDESSGTPQAVAIGSRERTALAIRTMARHPIGTAEMILRGSVLLMFGPGQESLRSLVGRPEGGLLEKAALAIFFLYLAATYVAALAGVVIAWMHERRRVLLALLTIVSYLWLVSAGPEAYSRFRIPMMPFICLLAGVGATWWTDLRSGHERERTPRPASTP